MISETTKAPLTRVNWRCTSSNHYYFDSIQVKQQLQGMSAH